jgi:hypothetical protein
MSITLNGAKVIHRNGTSFVALPVEAQRPIAGGCQCPYCQNHPDKTPMWDTLAIGADSPFAWTVHYPDFPR